MGSWGIFHRLSSVAVERPPPIPSPSALMYTTPDLRVIRQLLLIPPLPQLLEAPGVGHLRALVASCVNRIERAFWSTAVICDITSSEAVYDTQAIPSHLIPDAHV